ncbi:MAG: HD domain-containing protein [Desulfobulbaceae bacterium]|nr:HD domain-containing protein [Desulfobulbaceae bacterium]
MRSSGKNRRTLNAGQVAAFLGRDLMDKLARIGCRMHGPVYLTGGTVRDLLLDRTPVDIDLTVPRAAQKWAAGLAAMTGGAYVPLGRDEDAARVVWQGRDIDFSSFREGAESIEEELRKRDLTVNSMAVSIGELLAKGRDTHWAGLEVIDPVGGLGDLDRKIIRVTSPRSFQCDPLRLLRVFRFAASLDFVVDRKTFDLVVRQKKWISRPAAERVAYELDQIMRSDRAYQAVADLARSGIFFHIFPELRAGVGMQQPASHHLDVFEHALATLQCMVGVQQEPSRYFPGYPEVMEKYIDTGRNRVQLRWAALLHDLGKPSTMAIDEDRGGRITFYNHDRAGAELAGTIARRLKWSGSDTRKITGLVALHMRPFHLGNVRRKGALSLKACLRLVRLAGPDLPGLFLLSMADAMAGLGEGRPEAVEQEVASLFARMEDVYREHVAPVRSGPPLLTGRHLIDELHLAPGPVFREILDAVEEAHMEGEVTTKQEALQFVRTFLGSVGKPGAGAGG